MNFIDLAAQQKKIRGKIEARLRAVLDHGQYIMGPEIGILETELASYTGTKHAISCSSGTDALLMALMTYGVGPGDAIITTPFTFVATAEAVALVGAVPVFVDIDPATFNIDPALLEATILSLKDQPRAGSPIPRQIADQRPRIRGIIGVDLFGLPADYARISTIAKEHGLFVIEDAAQSFGAEYHGKKACGLADFGCTSFFPAKPLGAYGDAGMCFTDDDSTAEFLRSIRVHGQGSDKYENVRMGINGRLDTMQAAVLLAKMELFPEEIELRREKAETYRTLLEVKDSPVTCPHTPDGYSSAWAQYSVLAKNGIDRALLLGRLKQAGIPTAIYYPRPLHLQKAFAQLGYKEGDFPASEDCAGRIFSVPMHPYLKTADQERIAGIIKAA
ncbi:MAG: DegT/DnrJ/EryC1/StrS family aminotransferase [Syntrophobacter sp.]